jgi:hypothetical protein
MTTNLGIHTAAPVKSLKLAYYYSKVQSNKQVATGKGLPCCNTSSIIVSMKYGFVFISIIAVWVGVLVLASVTELNGTFLGYVALFMTVALFIIGFGRRA